MSDTANTPQTPTPKVEDSVVEVGGDVAALAFHIERIKAVRAAKGLPTCADPVSAFRKLSAVGEEYGEVCRAIQDDEGDERLRDELLDLAAAATLWAHSLAANPNTSEKSA